MYFCKVYPVYISKFVSLPIYSEKITITITILGVI